MTLKRLQCKHSYDAKWTRVDGHCPNLVPSDDEKKANRTLAKMEAPFAVTVRSQQTRRKTTDRYASLADMWSEWNLGYVSADYPRLVVRFEDTLFHAEKVMQLVKECAGIATSSKKAPFRYYMRRAKWHGESSNFTSAIIKYGTEGGRYDGLTEGDLEYAGRALDAELMGIFQYKQAPNVNATHHWKPDKADVATRTTAFQKAARSPVVSMWLTLLLLFYYRYRRQVTARTTAAADAQVAHEMQNK